MKYAYIIMPHLRKRYLESPVRKLLSFSPLVGIVGHRQVGKTTLASKFAGEYYSLDLRTILDLMEADPLGFLLSTHKRPVVLDECQHLPDLFPALKEYVRGNPKPGSFILTGSVRFTSRRAIRESLTGRIVTLELLPMSLSEIHQLPLPDSLIRIAKDPRTIQTLPIAPRSGKRVLEYLERGGLPGIFSIRDVAVRRQKIATQIETILDRDLRLLLDTSLGFSTLRNVLQFLAIHQGSSFKIREVERATRVSRPTIYKLLTAFEALFLIRPISCEGGAGRHVYYFEDQGEASFLLGHRTDPLFDLTRFLYANLRSQVLLRSELKSEIFRYETRGGAFVPLAFRIGSREIGIVPLLERYPNRSATASATSFLKTYPKSIVLFVRDGGDPEVVSHQTAIVPLARLV